MRTTATLLIATALAWTTAANAAGLRCGNDRVQRGDSISSVIEQCGEPKRQANLVNDYGKVIGSVYYYDSPNYGGSDRRITFRAGRVASIERVR